MNKGNLVSTKDGYFALVISHRNHMCELLLSNGLRISTHVDDIIELPLNINSEDGAPANFIEFDGIEEIGINLSADVPYKYNADIDDMDDDWEWEGEEQKSDAQLQDEAESKAFNKALIERRFNDLRFQGEDGEFRSVNDIERERERERIEPICDDAGCPADLGDWESKSLKNEDEDEDDDDDDDYIDSLIGMEDDWDV